MAKFKKGDRVRCVSDAATDIHVGKVYLVDGYEDGRVYFKDEAGCDRHRSAYRYELATHPTPDTVTIGGVEYVRKPEREHVWAWGQWARVKEGNAHYSGQIVFILGGVDRHKGVPFTSDNVIDGPVDWFSPNMLTYISDATIPE